jgi:hypothetical protein
MPAVVTFGNTLYRNGNNWFWRDTCETAKWLRWGGGLRYRCAEAVQQGRPWPTENFIEAPGLVLRRQVVDPAGKSIHYYPYGEREIRRPFWPAHPRYSRRRL